MRGRLVWRGEKGKALLTEKDQEGTTKRKSGSRAQVGRLDNVLVDPAEAHDELDK